MTDIEGLFMINLHTELKELFCEVSPYEFYRAIFPLFMLFNLFFPLA